MKKPKIVSFTSLKGGTGKTLVTFNVAALLAKEHNKKVLIIDVDPQHNSSNLLYKMKKRQYRSGVFLPSRPIPKVMSDDTIYVAEDIFESSVDANMVIKKSHIKGLDIVPTTINMTAIELQISGLAGRELIMKNWIYDNKEILSKYDYILMDTNPTMSVINTNVFICCDNIILNSDIDADSINSVETFLSLYYPIQHRIDRQLEDNVTGLLINKVKENNNLNKDFLEYVESERFPYDDILLKTKIHDAVALAETKIDRQPISESRNKRSYDEFMSLIEELQERGVL